MRYFFIDFLRFIAIALMVFYHFCFDLNFFKIIDIPIYTHWFWYYLPRLIVLLFFICVGFSLRLQHVDGIRWHKFYLWIRKLIFFALIISTVTYFMFPKFWIYFGTLHSISITALMALPFLRWPKISLLLGLSLLTAYFGLKFTFWFELPHPSLDYIPAIPWVGATLLGFYLHEKRNYFLLFNQYSNRFVQWCSKHSLKIYLLHQVILFPTTYLIKMVLK